MRVMQYVPGNNLGDLVWLTDDRLGMYRGWCLFGSAISRQGPLPLGPGLSWSTDLACFWVWLHVDR